MQAPLFVRPPTEEERQALAAGLRSADAFTLRRCQIVLASARGERAPAIARALGCSDQTVRNAIRAFDARGVAALAAGSSRPHTIHAAFDAAAAERLRALLHRSPREFGHADQRLDAGAGGRGGLRRRADRARASATRRSAPRWPGWASAGGGPSAGSPAPTRRTPKKTAPRPPDRPGRGRIPTGRWASRTRSGGAGWRRPALHAWTRRRRRCGWSSRRWPRTTPTPRRWPATGCWCAQAPPAPEAVWLRFVDGRPVSAADHPVPGLVLRAAGGAGARRRCCWSGTTPPGTSARRCGAGCGPTTSASHREGGVRIVPCFLPTKSPWLNPIEPKWVHGKRRVVEPARLLTAGELETRSVPPSPVRAAITWLSSRRSPDYSH